MKHDIFIYGDIGLGEQYSFAEEFGVVTLKDVRKQIIDAPKDTEELVVHIHSRGGGVDEGFAIHDILKNSGYKVTTVVEGFTASIATVIMLAGDTRLITENSELVIHNPFAGIQGTAEELEKGAEMLKKIEDKIVNMYVAVTGSDENAIRKLMSDEERITAKSAIELGFATGYAEAIKAVAYFSQDTNNHAKIIIQMSEQKTILQRLDAIAKKMGITQSPIPKDLELTTVDGVKLEIVTTDKIANVGDAVKIDGKTAEDGDYVMVNKETYVVKDGKISEIKPADKVELQDLVNMYESTQETMTTITDSLEAMTAAREQDIAAMDKKIKDFQDAISAKIDAMLEAVGSDYKPPAKKNDSGDGGEMSPVQAAIQRRKERDAAAKEK